MTTAQYIFALNQLFERRGIDLKVSASDLIFGPNMVTDAHSENRPVSGFLTRKFSPPIHHGEFYHYTPAHSLGKIIDSGLLRLTSIKKRISDEEIRDFLRRFGYRYPLEIDPETKAPRYYASIASSIFYISLTDASTITPTKDSTLWNNFAENRGARLKFRLNLQSGCLRRMMYGDQVDELADIFREIGDLTTQGLGKVFYWADAGTVCALQLPYSFESEEETRLITRRDCGLPLGTEGDVEYLELKIGQNPAIRLDISLIEIQTNRPVAPQHGVAVVPRIT